MHAGHVGSRCSLVRCSHGGCVGTTKYAVICHSSASTKTHTLTHINHLARYFSMMTIALIWKIRSRHSYDVDEKLHCGTGRFLESYRKIYMAVRKSLKKDKCQSYSIVLELPRGAVESSRHGVVAAGHGDAWSSCMCMHPTVIPDRCSCDWSSSAGAIVKGIRTNRVWYNSECRDSRTQPELQLRRECRECTVRYAPYTFVL
jgi:hypothetical protein